ncbi:hypothetical protein BFP97_07645 [Roseivirga sp. 4D4]|uniref:hypothetical protein n=1 Tax=Roseivirga sp. 4D4 TaxID=1889784 RepID=UPI0008536D9A|nr:hypothetical protein [Roseivirga sp. 4D4]OEK01399.1 hypothetical protein BFP97_07645 [Roseivirga sp. 4D4]
MDFDFSTALYLILGIIYFIFTGAKKKNQQGKSQPKRGRHSDPETVGPPPVSRKPTFEELLEEFTGQRTIREEPQLEPVPEVPAPPVKVYDTPKPAPKPALRKMDKPMASFKGYEIEEEVDQEDFREMFSSLDDAKKAFVASEVFNRKY